LAWQFVDRPAVSLVGIPQADGSDRDEQANNNKPGMSE